MDLELCLFAIVTLLVRVGLALYLIGVSRAKNSGAAAMRVIADLCVATLAFWAVGAALVWLDSWASLFDYNNLFGAEDLFIAALVLIATGSALGATLERSRFAVGLWMSVIMASLAIPLAIHWSWNGWLANLGYIDVAGAGFIHVLAGVSAAAGAYVIGPRQGKYHRDGSSSMVPGHNVPLVSIGVLVLWLGWFGSVIGATMLRSPDASPAGAAVDVLIAAAAGGLAGMSFAHWRFGNSDIYLTYAGLLGALVSITACAGAVGPWAAIVIGAVAGAIVPLALVEIDAHLKLDDPAGVVAMNAVGGAWGLLAAGIFAPGTIAQRIGHVGVQLLGILTIAAWAGGISLGSLWIMRRMMSLRLREEDEFEGADLAEHDLNAYPDFQQTMIKSYHLREQ